MEEQALKETDTRSILNAGFGVNPVKKRLNRLTMAADTGVKTVTRT